MQGNSTKLNLHNCMHNVLILGAGLSSPYLIKHLATHAKKENFTLTVADASLQLARLRTKNFKHVNAIELDINDKNKLEQQVENATVVVSLLPPALHVNIAKACIKFKKHLVTASYISTEMQALHKAALSANVLLLNEMGLDPGIDHLSAIMIINEIKKQGGEITSFKSYCGGLVAPKYDNNIWNYKFTWNPKNVVTAGQSAAMYLENGQVKYISPNRIFSEVQEIIIPGYGKFESYANRDSLSYIKAYGLESAKTVFRGTLRRKGFCAGWQLLVQLGLTDDKLTIINPGNLTNRSFLCAFVPGANNNNIEKQFCKFFNITPKSTLYKKIAWLGLFNQTPITLQQATPAQILLSILQDKWKLNPTDLDMVAMKHEITYKLKNKNYKHNSSLVVMGNDATYTAMAKTVGLPMAIATRLILKNKITVRGVQLPIYKEMYEPVLAELAKNGVKFFEG